MLLASVPAIKLHRWRLVAHVPPAMNRLGPPEKPAVYEWEKPRPGTLECIVNQTTLYPGRDMVHPGGMTMDALVPCSGDHLEPSGTCGTGWSTRVGSCSARKGSDTLDTNWESGAVFTSSSPWSPENTSSGNITSGEADHDSICQCRLQREGGDYEDDLVGKRKESGKSITSSRRYTASAIHSLSERKRRDKINGRMKSLQKLVPNSRKSDKASILDEVIEYVKQLQAQVQTMSNMMNMALLPQMMLQQQAWHQYLHHIFTMRMGANVMDLNPPTLLPITLPTSWHVQPIANTTFAPPDFLSAFLPYQIAGDGYSKLAINNSENLQRIHYGKGN